MLRNLLKTAKPNPSFHVTALAQPQLQTQTLVKDSTRVVRQTRSQTSKAVGSLDSVTTNLRNTHSAGLALVSEETIQKTGLKAKTRVQRGLKSSSASRSVVSSASQVNSNDGFDGKLELDGMAKKPAQRGVKATSALKVASEAQKLDSKSTKTKKASKPVKRDLKPFGTQAGPSKAKVATKPMPQDDFWAICRRRYLESQSGSSGSKVVSARVIDSETGRSGSKVVETGRSGSKVVSKAVTKPLSQTVDKVYDVNDPEFEWQPSDPFSSEPDDMESLVATAQSLIKVLPNAHDHSAWKPLQLAFTSDQNPNDEWRRAQPNYTEAYQKLAQENSDDFGDGHVPSKDCPEDEWLYFMQYTLPHGLEEVPSYRQDLAYVAFFKHYDANPKPAPLTEPVDPKDHHFWKRLPTSGPLPDTRLPSKVAEDLERLSLAEALAMGPTNPSLTFSESDFRQLYAPSIASSSGYPSFGQGFGFGSQFGASPLSSLPSTSVVPSKSGADGFAQRFGGQSFASSGPWTHGLGPIFGSPFGQALNSNQLASSKATKESSSKAAPKKTKTQKAKAKKPAKKAAPKVKPVAVPTRVQPARSAKRQNL